MLREFWLICSADPESYLCCVDPVPSILDLINVRDLGGIRSEEGEVRYRLLIRSAAPTQCGDLAGRERLQHFLAVVLNEIPFLICQWARPRYRA